MEQRTATIPFDLETAKKINIGEIAGRIVTEKGQNRAEIVYEDNSSNCPLLVVIHSISVSADWFSATGKALSSAEHNNGIALLFNRLDNKMFQDVVFPKAKGILFMKGRIKFHREDGTIGESPGCGSILVAFGEENAEILRSSNIEGRYIQVNQEPCNTHVDWEQRRYEMAKTMLPITSVSGRGPHGELILEACDKAAELAVIYADALIKELK